MKTKVVVICMTYNHAQFIEKTLQGFVSQKVDFPVCYIVRDDASTDETADIVRRYEKKYPSLIHGIYETVNQYGIHRDMPYSQKLILETDGEYYAFCEGDDYWCDDYKLKKQVDLMDAHPNATLCIHGHFLLNNKNEKLKPVHPYRKSGPISTKDVILEPYGMPATCSMLMRGTAIKKYPYDILKCPVGDRNRRAFLASIGTVLYIDELMSVYRINNSQSFGGKLVDYDKSLNLVREMNLFYDKFDLYTDGKYNEAISLVKEREWISHYMRFHDYKSIVNTRYYREYFPLTNKIKLFIKWRLEPLYTLYKKVNRY